MLQVMGGWAHDEAEPGRAVAYLRVSTEQQAESGLGLEAQRVSVTAAAARLGLTLVETCVDAGTSGSLAMEDRPVLLEAIARLKRGDVLLVAKRDRLGRDVIAVALIERLIAKRGARFVSAAGEGTDSTDPSGLLMRRLIDSFAEYERLMIATRTRAALAAKPRRGEWVSGVIPFGYRLARPCGPLRPR
jgi:DNA invertase Pin-like site-specific DNA recombinase